MRWTACGHLVIVSWHPDRGLLRRCACEYCDQAQYRSDIALGVPAELACSAEVELAFGKLPDWRGCCALAEAVDGRQGVCAVEDGLAGLVEAHDRPEIAVWCR
jgi:hypothetical protein